MAQGIIILNCGSGSAASLETLSERAASSLRGRGLEPVVHLVEPRELDAAIRSTDPGRAGLLVIGGGDGSIRAAASHAADHNIPLAILPMGTMNLFAKDLGVDLDPSVAADSLASGTIERVDLGEVNGHMFLHSAVLGVVPRMGAVREETRGRRGLAALAEAAQKFARVLVRERPIRAGVELHGKLHDVSTFMLAVSANRLRAKPVGALARESLQAGELGVYWATHEGRAGLVQLLGELGVGLWGLDERIERHAVEEALVHTSGWTKVSIDGELERLRSPLRFAVRPGVLSVLVPSSLDAGGAEDDA